MAVDGRIALAGEVLGRRGRPGVGQPDGERCGVLRHGRGVVAEAARAEVGVVGVGQQVTHGGVVHVHAEGPDLGPDGLAHPTGEVDVTGRSQGQVAGERRGERAEAEELAGLLVPADQHRPSGGLTDRVGELPKLVGLRDVEGAEQGHPHPDPPTQQLGGVGGEGGALEPQEEGVAGAVPGHPFTDPASSPRTK